MKGFTLDEESSLGTYSSVAEAILDFFGHVHCGTISYACFDWFSSPSSQSDLVLCRGTAVLLRASFKLVLFVVKVVYLRYCGEIRNAPDFPLRILNELLIIWTQIDTFGFITFIANIEEGLENDTIQRNMSITIEGKPAIDEDFQELKNRLEVSFGSGIQ